MHINDDSKSLRSIPIDCCVILHPIYICCGQSARDNIIDIIIHPFKQRCRRCTLPRGLGLLPIRKDVIGLVSRFGSIIVKCPPIGVYGI